MQRLLKKGICALLSFALLAVFPAFPSYADSYTYSLNGWRYTMSTTRRSVPNGARLSFQTPPLKKNEKLCYTAGNGEILSTFMAGKPIAMADGTVRYQLGFVCRKAGETGVYFHLNGKPFQLYSVQVVDDKSREGFPLSTSFKQIFANQKVQKIVVKDGNTGKTKQTSDATKISSFLAKLAPERLYRDCHPVKRVGWRFGVDFYLKGQEGYYSYSPTYGFNKVDGFSTPLPNGNCVEEDVEDVYNIIDDFYTSLK